MLIDMFPARPLFEEMIGIAGNADNQFVPGAPVLSPHHMDDFFNFAEEIAAALRCNEAFGINKDYGASMV